MMRLRAPIQRLDGKEDDGRKLGYADNAQGCLTMSRHSTARPRQAIYIEFDLSGLKIRGSFKNKRQTVHNIFVC